MKFNINYTKSYDIDENGIATLKDNDTGEIEELPVIAKDRNNKDVVLIYFEDNGELGFYVREVQYERGALKCASGIAGGAVTGGTTLGLAGAVVGTVGGAIGGGLTGGATCC